MGDATSNLTLNCIDLSSNHTSLGKAAKRQLGLSKFNLPVIDAAKIRGISRRGETRARKNKGSEKQGLGKTSNRQKRGPLTLPLTP
jgi:hypothetical protein